MVTPQILNLVDVTKAQKCRYIKNKTLFLLQIKKIINYTSRATLCQKKAFVSEITFNQYGIIKREFIMPRAIFS